MCGIVAYVGESQAYDILVKGLQRLEYRGYDSAGVAIQENGNLNIYKCAGKVADLVEFCETKSTKGTIGIGHTRWATHGEPNNINAHPHSSGSGDLSIIHNGIIENYGPLKKELTKRGHQFTTDTDTEVLIHLIEEIQENEKIPLEDAVRLALNEVVGAYAIVLLSKQDPDKLIAARKSSPLVIGIGDNEFFIASDATPIVEYTKNVVYLKDEEIAVVNRSGDLTIKTITNQLTSPYIEELELKLEMLEKGGFDHFMLKEINEQPSSVLDSMRGRINSLSGNVLLGGLKEYEQKLFPGQVSSP